MKPPIKVVFKFDPYKSDIPALSDKNGRILWACIKYQHIVSQHFNGNVQDVALLIAENKPKNYEDFKHIILLSGLNIFGTIGDMNCHNLDDEYWRGIWEYINGEKTLNVEIATQQSAKGD